MSRLRDDAVAILRAGIDAVDPTHAVARFLRRAVEAREGDDGRPHLELDRYRRILAVGAGKASARMCQAAEAVLGERLEGGVVVVKDGHGAECRRVETLEAAHPIPDERGLRAAERIASLCDGAGEETLVLCLLSGGASALLPMPAEGITLGEQREVTELLLGAGADIGEINAVRKHLSALKGGQLARRAAPAAVMSLLLSDVVGDRPDLIGSGPTVADPSTFGAAAEVLRRRGLWERIPSGARSRIERGEAGEIPETPKPGDPDLRHARHEIVGNNAKALDACAETARARGYRPLILASTIEGETRDVARVHAAIANEIRTRGRPVAPPACVISGGETTVTLRGHGKGGRNQEFALAAALDIAGREGVLVLSAGTDGTDGPTDAAGAIATGDTVARASEAGLDSRAALEDNDSYPLFDRIGDLIRTGPTGTNVMDIHLLMVE